MTLTAEIIIGRARGNFDSACDRAVVARIINAARAFERGEYMDHRSGVATVDSIAGAVRRAVADVAFTASGLAMLEATLRDETLRDETIAVVRPRFEQGGHTFAFDGSRLRIVSEAGELVIDRDATWRRDGACYRVPITVRGEHLFTMITHGEREALRSRGWIRDYRDDAERHAADDGAETNAERAEKQARVADAIRDVSQSEISEAVRMIMVAAFTRGDARAVYAALAAAAYDDTIADALAQVRQCIVLERGR